MEIAEHNEGHWHDSGRKYPASSLSREETLAHLRELVVATPLPVNADFESGFGETPEEVAESVRMAVDTGVAGISRNCRARQV